MNGIRRIERNAPGPGDVRLYIASGPVDVIADPQTATATVELSTPGTTSAAASALATARSRYLRGWWSVTTFDTMGGDIAPHHRGAVLGVPSMIVSHHRGHRTEIHRAIGAGGEAPLRSTPGMPTGPLGWEISAAAHLPPGSDLLVHTLGAVSVHGPVAEVRAVARYGDITITTAEFADVISHRGHITIGSAAGLAAIATHGGLTASVTGPADCRTHTGDITIHAHAAARILARTRTGNITVYTYARGITTDLHSDSGTIRVLPGR